MGAAILIIRPVVFICFSVFPMDKLYVMGNMKTLEVRHKSAIICHKLTSQQQSYRMAMFSADHQDHINILETRFVFYSSRDEL